MKFRIKDNNLEEIKEKPVMDADIDVPDLGFFDDAEVQDSITLVWKQLFNELVDEGENRIDSKIGARRGKESVDVLLKEVEPLIVNMASNLRRTFEENIGRVSHHLVKFVKENYNPKYLKFKNEVY